MRLLEFEGKDIFKEFDIQVPEGVILNDSEEVSSAIEKLGLPMVLKAQVPTGGRGKAGGIKIVKSEDEAKKTAKELLTSCLDGHDIDTLLAEEHIDIEKEIYCAVIGNDERGMPEIIMNPEGGVDIETIAEKDPEKMVRKTVDPHLGLKPYQARDLTKELGLEKNTFRSFSEMLFNLYKVFESYDAKLSEINPVALTKNGNVVAADSKVVLDDHSLFRHPEFEEKKRRHVENSLEKEAGEKGLNYVDLDGDIAVMANGAGLAMALMDVIHDKGYSPAAFLDTGGGLSKKKMEDALDLLFKKCKMEKKVKAILVNIRLMISPPDAMVEGLLSAVKENKDIEVPVILVVRGRKSYVKKAMDLLKDSDIDLFKDVDEGVKVAIEKTVRW